MSIRPRLVPSLRIAGPAAAAFLAGRAILWAAARRDRFDFWDAGSWVRYDSEHYLAIARAGYELQRCAADSAYGADAWCGNTGWLPGYPAAIGAVQKLGIAGPVAGVLLSALCHLVMLVLLASWWRDASPWRVGLALAVVALAPGQVYHHAVFPVSLFALLAVAAMGAAVHGRARTAGLLGALAAFSYSTGFLLAPVLALGILWHESRSARSYHRAAWVSGLTACGFGAALAVQWLAVGQWDAFFKVQAKYGHGWHWPGGPVAFAVSAVSSDLRDWIAWQTILVAGLMLALIVALATRWLKPQGPERFLAVFAGFYWLFPLVVGGRLSLYRAESLLLPALVMTRRLPVVVQLLLLVVLGYLDYRMGIRFFRGILV